MAHPLESGVVTLVSAIWHPLMGMTGLYAVLLIEVPLIIASKYCVVSIIEDMYRVSHPHNLPLQLLAADGGCRPHTFNCNG